MYKFIIIQEDFKIEGYFETLEKAVEKFKIEIDKKNHDLNQDGKVDEEDFEKAGKTLNKAKNNNQ
jgi:hypothetical protein